MVPQGPPNGSQPVHPSLLRSNSGSLGGAMSSQNAFPSLLSSRNHFNNNMNMLGNLPNASSLLQNGGTSSGIGSSQSGGLIDNGLESDPLSTVANGMGFSSITTNPISSGQIHGHQQQQQQYPNLSGTQMLTDQEFDPQNFRHNQQFSAPNNPQSQQQQFQATRGGLGGVKVEPQSTNDQVPHQLRNLGAVKLEPQQLHGMRSLGSVKMEPQNSISDPSLFSNQQNQQQQQQLLMSRQSSQAAAAAQILQQQRLMQMQNQQQILKSMPQQRSPQFQPQNLPVRSPVKPVYEPGMCARRLTHYMYQQQHRPEDNNIEFWKKFVAEYFAPNAKKKWCVSLYGSGRQTTGVFPQDVWHCEICNRKPGRGFEATAEVLPRLFKIKYESGTLEELLYVDMPREYQNSSGQIVLDYAKAIQESVFEQLRVVREGQLRIVFSPDLKICSWEFCARRHEELIPRRLLIPQVSQLGAAVQKYQSATTQNAQSNVSVSEQQNNCNMLVSSARHLAKALEVPLVNDLGYTKRYVRCLQISEVVNSMKDLIDYSRETGTGPMESLAKIPRRTNPSPGFQITDQPHEGQLQQQMTSQNNDNSALPSVNNTLNSIPSTSSTNPIGLLHQNSTNSRPVSNSNSPYNNAQIPSPVSSNPHQTSHTSLSVTQLNSSNITMQQPALSSEANGNDSQSSVQKIIHDMRMSCGGGMMGMGSRGSDVKNVNGMLNGSINGNNCLVGNGGANGNIGGLGFGNGIRASLGNNNSLSMNGRVGMGMARESTNNQMQQDLGNQLLGNIGTVNGFNNNLQFDWKTSP